MISCGRCVPTCPPKKVLDNDSRISLPSMYDLGIYVPRIYNSHEQQQIHSEWRNLNTTTLSKQLFEKDVEIIDFYSILSGITDNEGNYLFRQFASFALEVMSLPTSNADAERLFSKSNLLKTDKRNRL